MQEKLMLILQENCNAFYESILKYVEKKYGVHLDQISEVREFSIIHPELYLPDDLAINGPHKDIFINLHPQFFNNVEHSHSFFEIIYVYKGTVIEVVDGKEITLKKGEVCIHNPRARHKIIKFNEDEDILLNILLPRHIFNKSFYSLLIFDVNLDRFFNRYMTTSSYDSFMVFYNLSPNIEWIIDWLLKEFLETECFSNIVLEATLMLLFGEFLREYGRSKDDSLATEIYDYISKNLSSASLENASTYFKYHPKYLSYLVRKKTGRTFQNLVIEMRMRKALTYFQMTDYPIEKIVELIGYKDNSSLYAHFKKQYGVTPAKCRLDEKNENITYCPVDVDLSKNS